jgi:hypothetical protein
MKKLLLLALISTTFISADTDNVDVLEKDEHVYVLCIGGHVFISGRGNAGGLVQFMLWSEIDKALKPVLCSQYPE